MDPAIVDRDKFFCSQTSLAIVSPKVFGIGLNKTGTTTLGECLRTLGFRHAPYRFDLLHCVQQDRLEEIFEYSDLHDSFEDWPWPLLYPELDRRYPSSKFILTTRADSATWFRSLRQHADRNGPSEFRRIVYGYEMPNGREAEHISLYEQHNSDVREYFRTRPRDFLEVCWETGAGWPELCAFLNEDVPAIGFPHVNSAPVIDHRRPSIFSMALTVRRFFRI